MARDQTSERLVPLWVLLPNLSSPSPLSKQSPLTCSRPRILAMFPVRSAALVARTGVRGYAVAAANASKSFKPPVALFGVDGTYASALV